MLYMVESYGSAWEKTVRLHEMNQLVFMRQTLILHEEKERKQVQLIKGGDDRERLRQTAQSSASLSTEGSYIRQAIQNRLT